MASASFGISLLRSLASNWLGLFVGVAVSFFLSPFVVGKLGASWYGVWAVVGQFTGYLFLLDFGVRESVVRYTSKYAARGQAAQLNRVLSSALLIYGAITLLTLLASAVLTWRVPHWFTLEPQYWHDARLTMAFSGLAISLTFLLNIFTGIVSGLRRWDIANALGIVTNLLRAGLIVVFLSRGHGIVAVAAIQFLASLAGGLATTVVALALLRNGQMPFALAFPGRRRFLALSKRILGYGAYVAVTNIGEKLITATDAIVVGLFLPIASVAYYAIAGSLVGYQRAVLATTAQIFNPLASHLHAGRQQAELREAFLLGVTINVLITLPVGASFVVLGEEFVGLWMGAEFAKPSGAVLAVLAATAVFSAPQYIASSVLYGISRHGVLAVLRVVEALVNLGLSVLLVQTIGLLGVALGTAIPSLLIGVIVLPILTCSVVGASLVEYYERGYLRPLGAVIPFVLGAYWLRIAAPAANLAMFFAQVFGLALLYLPCALMVGLKAKDRNLLVAEVRMRLRSISARFAPGGVRRE